MLAILETHGDLVEFCRRFCVAGSTALQAGGIAGGAGLQVVS